MNNNDQTQGEKKIFQRKRFEPIKFKLENISYKKPEILKRFISEKGKIQSRKFTNASAKNQRILAREIKRARFLALLPNK